MTSFQQHSAAPAHQIIMAIGYGDVFFHESLSILQIYSTELVLEGSFLSKWKFSPSVSSCLVLSSRIAFLTHLDVFIASMKALISENFWRGD